MLEVQAYVTHWCDQDECGAEFTFHLAFDHFVGLFVLRRNFGFVGLLGLGYLFDGVIDRILGIFGGII